MLSVIVRSKNDAELIGRTLSRIHSATREEVEVIGIDSGSDDGTLEIQASFADRLFSLPPERYCPGKVLNFCVEQARGDVVVFLNSDCVPLARRWLTALTTPILRGEADVTFGRQDPRPDAWELVRKDNLRAFGDGSVAAGWHHFFSLAVSAFRRDLLLERPFPVQVQYSEDLAWREANPDAVVRYVPAAQVEHSHNYPLPAVWKRFRGEGRADARIFAQEPPPNARLGRALLSAGAELVRDAAWLIPRGTWRELPLALSYRVTQRLAYWQGLREGRRVRGEPEPAPGTSDWASDLQITEHSPTHVLRRSA